jgi:pyruvate dehydrogenase E1 component beta subunit
MRKTTYIQAVNEAIKEEMRRDENVFLIGEDIGHYGGLFRVTRNLLDEFGEKRVIDTPISEQGFMGMATGAAMVGMRPIVELMYMDFFMVCADQIFNQAAKMHYMTGGLVKVPLVIRGQHGGGKRYGSQHSQCVESSFAQFPGIKVVARPRPMTPRGCWFRPSAMITRYSFWSTRCSISHAATCPTPTRKSSCPSARRRSSAKVRI